MGKNIYSMFLEKSFHRFYLFSSKYRRCGHLCLVDFLPKYCTYVQVINNWNQYFERCNFFLQIMGEVKNHNIFSPLEFNWSYIPILFLRKYWSRFHNAIFFKIYQDTKRLMQTPFCLVAVHEPVIDGDDTPLSTRDSQLRWLMSYSWRDSSLITDVTLDSHLTWVLTYSQRQSWLIPEVIHDLQLT